jgi:hypothetical protein
MRQREWQKEWLVWRRRVLLLALVLLAQPVGPWVLPVLGLSVLLPALASVLQVLQVQQLALREVPR